MKESLESASVNALRAESDHYQVSTAHYWPSEALDWQLKSTPLQAVARVKSATFRGKPVQRLCQSSPKPVPKHLYSPPPIRLLPARRLTPHIVPNQVFLNGLPVGRLPLQRTRSVAVQAPISFPYTAKEEVVSFARLDMGKGQTGEPEWRRLWRGRKGRLVLQIENTISPI